MVAKTVPRALGDVLATAFADGSLGSGGTLLELRRGWVDAVGPELARHARLVAFRGGAVMVEVDHAVYSQELKLRERQVLESLRASTGLDLHEIRFRVGSPPRAGPRPGEKGAVESRSGFRLAPGSRRHIRAAVAEVADADLKVALDALVDRLEARSPRLLSPADPKRRPP